MHCIHCIPSIHMWSEIKPAPKPKNRNAEYSRVHRFPALVAIHFPKHIKASCDWSDYGSYKSPPSINQSAWLKLQTGDELSKRSKFVFCTWIGPNVSVMKKAKMGTDKAFVKEVIQVIYQIAFVRYRVQYYSTSFSECWVFYFECCWAVLTYWHW